VWVASAHKAAECRFERGTDVRVARSQLWAGVRTAEDTPPQSQTKLAESHINAEAAHQA
jgi:hypothetical protein